ncbi:UNVERIFIED_CONTAM: hypothetical protein Sradi_5726200 [Sesamum radiatum]|uniref:Uncharacterized protein n=1 Tax=Sesamum radiatum TaxID=300843 RepID=A0AAW2L3V1_SESRA
MDAIADEDIKGDKNLSTSFSTKHTLLKSLPSAPANSIAIRDPKGKQRVNPIHTPTKWAKGQTNLLAHPTRRLVTRAGMLRFNEKRELTNLFAPRNHAGGDLLSWLEKGGPLSENTLGRVEKLQKGGRIERKTKCMRRML